jgi:hypothetical protein
LKTKSTISPEAQSTAIKAENDAIEKQIAALNGRKDTMSPYAYDREITRLGTQLLKASGYYANGSSEPSMSVKTGGRHRSSW